MVSRRNFFTITVLMCIIFFLCMASNNLKDALNDYTANLYTETAENYPSQVNIYIPGSSEGEGAGKGGVSADEASEASALRHRVVFIGGEGLLRDVVWEWAAYSKRDLWSYEALADYEAAAPGEPPEMLVIDTETVDWTGEADVAFLKASVERGTNLIFPSLPDVSVIEEKEPVRELLGIRKIVAREKAAAGLHLYEGFLLGGETVYLPREEEDREEREESFVFPGDTDGAGNPAFPWYLLTSGTKVYMKGIPEDESVETEDYPALIWRKSFGEASVFAVNGGYMEGIQSLGLLSAMAAEMHPYEIYPVLNAQNMIFTGYPSLAEENGEAMEHYYTRSMPQVFQEILWPNTWIVLDRYQYKITCMMTPQYDYTDDALPDGNQFEYYLKMFREQEAEVGLSGQSVTGLSAAEKLREDEAFFRDTIGSYDFSSFYAGNLEEKEIRAALGEDILSGVRTVVRDYREGESGMIGFLSEYVTAQKAFSIGLDYTYQGDFLVRCLETALGYLNISFDMERVAYPESDEDAWEKLSRDFGITVSRYANSFGGFDATTASECDVRIRNFLALDYEAEREGDAIRLQVTGNEGPVWFVLRTHHEKVAEVEGGSFEQLEQEAWLIGIEDGDVMIRVEPSDERYYR